VAGEYIMSTARKSAIVKKARPMSEMASEVRQGLETLARAICAGAVSQHAKNLGEHAEMAACLWAHVEGGFRETKVNPKIAEWLDKLLKAKR
jgi:hypothetical protein